MEDDRTMLSARGTLPPHIDVEDVNAQGGKKQTPWSRNDDETTRKREEEHDDASTERVPDAQGVYVTWEGREGIPSSALLESVAQPPRSHDPGGERSVRWEGTSIRSNNTVRTKGTEADVHGGTLRSRAGCSADRLLPPEEDDDELLPEDIWSKAVASLMTTHGMPKAHLDAEVSVARRTR